MDWNNFIQNIGVFGVGSGILAYLIKQLFAISINRDLEKFKSDLQVLTIEHQIKYSRLHTERAEILKNIYQKIVELQSTVNQIIYIRKTFPRTEDRVQQLQNLADEFKLLTERIKEFSAYFELNKLFFNEVLCQLINNLLEKFWNIYRLMNIMPPIPDHPFYKAHNISLEDFFASENKEAISFLDMNNEEIPKLKQELENQFRNLMGVTTHYTRIETDGE